MNRKPRAFKKREQYMIPIDGKLYETTADVYEAYYRMDRRERYLEERDTKEGVLNFTSLTKGTFNYEEVLPDINVDVEKEITDGMLLETVFDAIAKLEESERQLIQELFFSRKTLSQIARDMDVPRKTLAYRKMKAIEKIKKLVKK